MAKATVTVRVLPGCAVRVDDDTTVHAGYELDVDEQDAKALEDAGLVERLKARPKP